MIFEIWLILTILGLFCVIKSALYNVKLYALIYNVLGLTFLTTAALHMPLLTYKHIAFFDQSTAWLLIGFIFITVILFFYKLLQVYDIKIGDT